ncbi:MAG: CRISPR-associated endonuclease Cas3'', partial [Bacillota bacterium]
MYGAHINPYNSEVQSVKQHLKNVSELSREYAAKISLPTVGELIGLLHDLGKICERFNNYLHYSHSHPEDKSLRGTVNHSTAGAKLIYDSFFHSKDLFEKFTSQLIALVICSHHGGLIDCIDLDGIDIFTHKLKTEQDICYEEALSNFYKECIDYSAIKHLFSNAVKELKDVLSELNRMDASSQNRNFLSGMLVKYLYSCLIDADRYDTFCFMENKEPQKKVGVASLWEELQKTLEFKLSQHPMESEIDILR